MGEAKPLEDADLLRGFVVASREFMDYAALFCPGPIHGSTPLWGVTPEDLATAERLAYRAAVKACAAWPPVSKSAPRWFSSDLSPLRLAAPGILGFEPNFFAVLYRWGFEIAPPGSALPGFAMPPESDRWASPLYVAPVELESMTRGLAVMDRAARAGGSTGLISMALTPGGLYRAEAPMPEVVVEFDSPAVVIDGESHPITGPPALARRAALYVDALLRASERGTNYRKATEVHEDLAGDVVTNVWKIVPEAVKALCEDLEGKRINARPAATNSD